MNFIYFEYASKFDSLLLSRTCFLQFRLLLSRIAAYLQFVTMNCLIAITGTTIVVSNILVFIDSINFCELVTQFKCYWFHKRK